MRPYLKPCPICGAGAEDSNPNKKKEIKIDTIFPVKGAWKEIKGCYGILIRCTHCGNKVGPFYQRKENKKIVETFDELKQRAADEWNSSNYIQPKKLWE